MTMGKRSLQTASSLVLNGRTEGERQRTYIVFGTRRGGTSAAAGVLRALGLDLGDVGTRKTNEDPAFQAKPLNEMRTAIKRRNAEKDVWGWKFAGAGSYLPELVGSVRNPYFVVVFRDPVAAALSQARLDREHNKRSPSVALHESNANSNANMGLALASGRPCLLISNEKAVQYPDSLIDEIADFLYAPRPEDPLRTRILDYISPGRYKAFDDYFGPGAVDSAPAEPSGGPLQRLRRRKS
jgi:hypothetical protein